MRIEALILAMWIAGCAGYRRVAETDLDSLPPSQHVQVWVGKTNRVLHRVSIDTDSLRGVPFQLPRSCDTCRVAYARAAIDSVRFGSEENRGWLWTAGVGAGLILLWVFIQGLKSNYP